MQDEGVGIHALRALQDSCRFEPEIELVDGGTSGLDLLPFFGSHRQMMMLDAMSFDAEPGTIGRVENEDILARLNTKTSVHHLGLSDLLAMAQLTDQVPQEIVLFGVQPGSMELEVGMTTEVEAAIPKLLDYVVDQLKTWGISSKPHRSP